MRKAIIIGASSGIGRAVTLELAHRGYAVGITARRKNLLEELQQTIGPQAYMRVMDVTEPEKAQAILQDLISQMGGLDLIVISAGTGTSSLSWDTQKEVMQVNVIGFVAMANTALDFFLEQNKGHIVGISSVAGIRGFASAPVYNASKSFISIYLEGLRARIKNMGKNLYITDIQPGFVNTSMGQGSDFWRSSPEEAAQVICNAIEQKKKRAYVTQRWVIIAWALRLLPDYFLYAIDLNLFPNKK